VTSWAAEVLERLRVVVVAGVFVGVLVGGLASRLAMGLLRVTTGASVHGVTSDDGFIIGRVTLGGTYGLLMLGAVVGMIGAAAYRVVAPWLIGPDWFRRVTTAAASGAVVGSMLLHADGIDFRLLEPTWLAMGLFVGLPVLFGAVIGPVVDRVAAPGSWTSRGPLVWVLPIVLVAVFPPTLMVLVVAAPIVAVWVPLRHRGLVDLQHRLIVRQTVRVAWLAVAIAGSIALIGDVRAITA
jgi:hypothetical protein